MSNATFSFLIVEHRHPFHFTILNTAKADLIRSAFAFERSEYRSSHDLLVRIITYQTLFNLNYPCFADNPHRILCCSNPAFFSIFYLFRFFESGKVNGDI